MIAEYASKHPLVVRISDWVYYLFFHHIALVALFLFASRSHLEQLRYITSLLACYLIGALSYYIIPTLGPIYFDQTSFGYIAEYAPFTAKIQDFLFFSTELSIQGKLRVIETFAFIAGTPSLHMAHESIILYFSRRSPFMLLLSATLWIASLVAVLVLGWHYPSDALAGVVLAAIAIGISSIIFKNKQPS
jgi:membrane-associated phospholipid phosphatase